MKTEKCHIETPRSKNKNKTEFGIRHAPEKSQEDQ
jgi:hypothetical protein